jgi:hypothetical protein
MEVKGRGEMEKLFIKSFQANPGAKIAITIEEVKQLTPDVQVKSRGRNRDADRWYSRINSV